MKNYNEMANDVLRRIGEHEEKQKRKRQTITRIGSIAACFCIAAIVGITAWNRNFLPSDSTLTTNNAGYTQSVNEPTENSEHTDDTNVEGPINYVPDGSEIRFIASYNDGIDTDDPCDIIPKDGETVFSQRLENAMKEFGNSAQYLVNVEVFTNGKNLEANTQQVKAVREKLTKAGYIVVYSVYNDGSTEHYSFYLQATLNDLNEFKAYENYGYRLSLY